MTPTNIQPPSGPGWRETFILQTLTPRALQFLESLRRYAGQDGRSAAFGRELACWVPGFNASSDVENFLFHSPGRPGDVYAKQPTWLDGVWACAPDGGRDVHFATLTMRENIADMTRTSWSALASRRAELKVFHGDITNDHKLRMAGNWWA
jgi:hypothetical protein